MGYGVFVYRSESTFKDNPSDVCQFPRQYLGRVQPCIGDWIIYDEPRKVAVTRGYVAVAKVERVISDPEATGLYLALIELGSYLDFANPVPFNGVSGVVEQSVLNEQERISGRAQSAVHPIAPSDFKRIVALGLSEAHQLTNRTLRTQA